MKILALFGLGAFAASPPPLGDDAIFVAIETTTKDVINPGGRAEGQCHTSVYERPRWSPRCAER